MSPDPLQQLAAHRRAGLLADAQRHALARSARRGPTAGARLRSRTARLLVTVAARLEIDPVPEPRHSSGL